MTAAPLAGTDGPPRLTLRRSSLLTGLMAVLLFTALGGLFRVGPATGLVWLGLTALLGLWIIARPALFSRILGQNWAILALPGFAILSTAWSAAPSATLVNAVQMLITAVVVLYLGERLRLRRVMAALLVAMGGAVLLSLANLASGALQPVWEVNGAFLGIFTHKNLFGKAAFWAAFAWAALCLLRPQPRPILALVPVTLTLPLCFLAQSMTGVVAHGFVLALVWGLALARMTGAGRFLALGLPLLALAGVALVHVGFGGNLVGDLLVLAGKSPTITGRTVIWQIGIETWATSPLAGIGMQAFWSGPAHADLVAYISANVDDGLHGFHNGYVEILVALGLVGFIWFAGLILVAAARLWHRMARRRSVEAVVWLAMLAAVAGLALGEDSLFNPRSGHFVLLVLALQAALAPRADPGRANAAASRSPGLPAAAG